MQPKILQPVEGWTVEYPQVLELAEKAQEVFWLAREIQVEADVNKFLIQATDAQRHAINTIAQVFVAQELSVANYWIGRIYKDFPRPEFRAMSTYFGMTEQAIHARFYAKLPEALGLDADPDFYDKYLTIPEFRERMTIVGEALNSDDLFLSIATFAIIEKVTLFTQFAVIKSFNVAPYNIFPKVADGINFSSVDENYHGEGGILLFNLLRKEVNFNENTYADIVTVAKALLEHEYHLLDLIYEKGSIDTVTKEDLKLFLHHRWNDSMTGLGFANEAVLPIGDNPVAKWFYKGIHNKMTSTDNFAALSNTYNRKWLATNFTWESAHD